MAQSQNANGSSQKDEDIKIYGKRAVHPGTSLLEAAELCRAVGLTRLPGEKNDLFSYFRPSISNVNRSADNSGNSQTYPVDEQIDDHINIGDSPGMTLSSSSAKTRQLYLDLGQKNFYLTKCPGCDMVYNTSDTEDMKIHKKYHRTALAEEKSKAP